MKKLLKVFVLLFIASFSYTFAATAVPEGTGFIQKNIWYSKLPLIEGETVKIYTLINNPTDGTLSGTAEFSDKGTILASKQFSVPAHSFDDVFVDWKITAGDHSISAKITKAKITQNGVALSATIPNTTTGIDQNFVESKMQPVSTKPAESTTSSDTTENVKGELDKAENFINDKTPIGGWLASTDQFRVETAEKLKVQADIAKKAIDEQKNEKKDAFDDEFAGRTDNDTVGGGYITDDTEGALKRPFAYVKYMFFESAHFIFNHKALFYGLIIILVIVIFKSIFRTFF